jgi:hypothetical protein
MAAPLAPQPSPTLTPQQVVQVQLKALQHVDSPVQDAGFATVYRFTSPENREQTGPLPQFSRMIRAGFGELLNHRKAELSPLLQQGEQVLVPVAVTSINGQRFHYVFVLRRQVEGNYKGCWMTDGVVPQDDDQAAGKGNEV